MYNVYRKKVSIKKYKILKNGSALSHMRELFPSVESSFHLAYSEIYLSRLSRGGLKHALAHGPEAQFGSGLPFLLTSLLLGCYSYYFSGVVSVFS